MGQVGLEVQRAGLRHPKGSQYIFRHKVSQLVKHVNNNNPLQPVQTIVCVTVSVRSTQLQLAMLQT